MRVHREAHGLEADEIIEVRKASNTHDGVDFGTKQTTHASGS